MTENPSISIIVPVLNEEGSLDKFYNETTKSLNEYSNWEIIFIDDGSDDESYNIMRKLADEDNRVSIIQFFKNFGKADALSEGFKHAMGDIIITTDSNYVKDGITLWINKWKTNEWKTSNKKIVKNSDLWKELDFRCKKLNIEWKWVKAHSGQPLNEEVDGLAREQAESI